MSLTDEETRPMVWSDDDLRPMFEHHCECRPTDMDRTSHSHDCEDDTLNLIGAYRSLRSQLAEVTAQRDEARSLAGRLDALEERLAGLLMATGAALRGVEEDDPEAAGTDDDIQAIVMRARFVRHGYDEARAEVERLRADRGAAPPLPEGEPAPRAACHCPKEDLF